MTNREIETTENAPKRYPVSPEAIRILGILQNDLFSSFHLYDDTNMHEFNARATHLSLQLNGIIPFEGKPEFKRLPPISEKVNGEPLYLAFFYARIEDERACKLALHNSCQLVHFPQKRLIKDQPGVIKFSIYSITKKAAMRAFETNRELFTEITFPKITVPGTGPEYATPKRARKVKEENVIESTVSIKDIIKLAETAESLQESNELEAQMIIEEYEESIDDFGPIEPEDLEDTEEDIDI